MKKTWQIFISIALIVILLGAVFIGVGLITGADTDRIFSVLDTRYNLGDWLEYISQVWDVIWGTFWGEPNVSDALVMTVG